MLKDITFNIKKSRRKTLSIYIERDGTVTVIAPESLTDQEIESKDKPEYKCLCGWKGNSSQLIEKECLSDADTGTEGDTVLAVNLDFALDNLISGSDINNTMIPAYGTVG